MKPANTRLTEAQVLEIRELRAAGLMLVAIGKQFGIAMTTVSDIALGRSWKELPMVDRRISVSIPAAVAGRRAALERKSARIERERRRLASQQTVAEARAKWRHERDPDVRRFRDEKQRHGKTVDRRIEEARAEFEQHLDRMASARRGGRPKKRKVMS